MYNLYVCACIYKMNIRKVLAITSQYFPVLTPIGGCSVLERAHIHVYVSLPLSPPPPSHPAVNTFSVYRVYTSVCAPTNSHMLITSLSP